EYFDIRYMWLDDTTAPSILEIASHSKELKLGESGLSDSAAFITQLASMDITRVSLYVILYFFPATEFFTLPRSFWRTFLNEKLANGSFECVEIAIGREQQKFTMAPIDLPEDAIILSMKWTKAR
ncbi:hypothetical protein PMAYCL1PPCAC_27443, partial [Pristionchus mayeri]